VAKRLDVVGIHEIAEMLGVSRQRVDKLSRSDQTFPQPIAQVHAGRIWLKADIEDWVKHTGRTFGRDRDDHAVIPPRYVR
jgi:predicted DNA-binding transcriptional regulator AlpA